MSKKMGVLDEEDANRYKEEGNEAFNNNDLVKAVESYTKAIKLAINDSRDLSIYYKNRAAAYLKLNKLDEAVNDCDKSLQIVPTDPKALFRRCQALDSLERYEEAYRDARTIQNEDPNNKAIQPILEKLHTIVQERARKNAQVTTKVESMTKISFDVTADKEKRETAMNNLLVLSREKAGSEIIIKSNVVQEIKRLLKVEKNRDIYVAAIRIIAELCKHNVNRTTDVVKIVGLPWFLEIIDSKCDKQVNAAQYCMQTILNTFSGMDNKADTKPNAELIASNKNEIDTLLTCLVCSINHPAISGLARDAIMELIMKNIHYDALNWAEQMVEIGGVGRLMDVASELEDIKYESSMNITPSTRTVAAVCLARIYENMYYDQAREKYMSKIEEFIKEKLLNPEMESKIRVTVALTSLLRGPLDVGNAVIGKEGIMQMILVMANDDDDILQQRVACECIIAAASKPDKAKAILNQGVGILKKLYMSKNDNIRVRALVGLCKLGSSGGNDASIKPFADGANLKLAEACRKFLLHPGNDQDMRKWSAEGLSYLTLDAEVKEKLIEDRAALRALIELAKTGDQSVLYGVITTLVNLCNAYEKQEMIPEMVELAKFAKHHIPEEHEFDDQDFVAKRILILGEEGVTSALVALSKTESSNSKELISRVFNALCSELSLRGSVVQQGGVKVLMALSLNGTDKGKRHAAQAIARIAISINPEVAFPGQRALEIVRPLISLLAPDCNALENFEALLALCNLAQLSESARLRILKEGGLAKIEHYMYEDHVQLCRAATQCITNLTMSQDIIEIFEGENDRVKFLINLSMDEDVDTSLAASGAVAILTSSSEKCCEKIFDSKIWLDAVHFLLANTDKNLQYRGVTIVKNMMASSRDVAQKLIETDVMEILMALTKVEDAADNIVNTSNEALKEAEKWGIIKKPDNFDPFAAPSITEEDVDEAEE